MRSALRTVQDGHAETVPGTLSFFFLVLPFWVFAFAAPVLTVVVVVGGFISPFIVVAMLAVLVVLAVLLSLALLCMLAVLLMLLRLETLLRLRLQRLFLLAAFCSFSVMPPLLIANGPSRPSPNPRETVTISRSGSGVIHRASPLGVCA
jgi:hypothetical protein